MSAPQLGRSRGRSHVRRGGLEDHQAAGRVDRGQLADAVGFPPLRRDAHQVPDAVADVLHVHLRSRDVRASRGASSLGRETYGDPLPIGRERRREDVTFGQSARPAGPTFR